ncbi:MAG: hypothetical protein H6R00_488 [Proteobacteria bacterium]|nr:hypothetical protein [Pseudomonadota bacterium]
MIRAGFQFRYDAEIGAKKTASKLGDQGSGAPAVALVESVEPG